jgi:peptidyl-dipeptidase Dcp
MRTFLPLMAGLAAAVSMASCGEAPQDPPAAPAHEPAVNKLLEAWTGPYGGVPAFDQMDIADIVPAMETAMARSLAELEVIASQSEPPTFENTILAMERSGDELRRVYAYWGVWSSNLSSPEFRIIQQEMAPRLADYQSSIRQNEALFARVRSVYEGEAFKRLEPAQQRLVWLVYDDFVSYGATLQGEDRERHTAINQRLAELQTRFANNVLADEEGYVTFLNEHQLGGLPDSLKAAAAAAALEKGKPGMWAITNTRSSMDPFLTYSDNRALRETVWRNYYNRGNNGGEYDNNAIIAEILQLRHERAKLLGYDNFAEWQLQNRMARKPEAAMDLMEAVWPPAVARVKEEVADMQAIADAEGADITIAPWDYRYYAEKVRRARYDLDSDEVRQYLQLDKLREAMFFVAGELFGFEFTPVPEDSVPVFHPDVKVWEVTDRNSGAHIGLWYLDPFARAGKRSGAWATTYRGHETFNGKRTVLASNNSNFVKGAPGEPVLISWDDAETYFHEFGHALHYLSSTVAYPGLNGGVRDYTEFQSQLLERWLSTDPVIDRFLVHYRTGEPIPRELVEKIKAAATFNQGFKTTEAVASALLDMKFHTTAPAGLDPQAFEQQTLASLDMPAEVVMRHRSTQFGHIFSGESYAAGYYGYLWADVLTADAAEAFAESPGGFYDPDMSKKLVDKLFAVRNSVDPAEAYRTFRGRDATIDALLRDRGFPVADASGYKALVDLFQDWRAFERPPLLDGAPDYTRQGFERRQPEFLALRQRLQAIDPSTWPVPRQVDWQLLRAEMNGYDFNRRVLKPWERDPAYYQSVWMARSDVPAHEGPAHHALTEFWTYALPLSAAEQKRLIGDLAVIPPLYRQARDNLIGNARELWIAGIRVIRDQLADLDTIAARTADSGNSELEDAIAEARAATASLVEWLEAEAVNKTGPSGIGKEHYTWYQQNVHLVPLTWDDEVRLLKRELDRAWSSLKLEEHRNRNLPPMRAAQNAEEYDALAERAAERLMAFLEQQEIVTVEDYFEPALREHLGRFVPAETRNFFWIVAHYDPAPLYSHFWHWFELARMDREPHASPIRRGALLYNIFDSGNEGTATGVEEMFMHAGLYDDSPRSRELVWIMLAQRAARGLGSLYAHANEMTMEEAGRVHMEWTPRGWMKTERDLLIFEQHLYLRQPGYGTSYVTGKYLLERTLADYAKQREERGEPFSLRQFFDALNATDSIPIALSRWEMTGLDDEIEYLLTTN